MNSLKHISGLSFMRSSKEDTLSRISCLSRHGSSLDLGKLSGTLLLSCVDSKELGKPDRREDRDHLSLSD